MARSLNVVLQKDIAHLGKGGDVVKVAPGFARNYLVPQGLALPASEGNVRRFEHIKRVASERAAKERAESQALAQKLAAVSVTLSVRAGAEGKLYGSITTRDVEEALKAIGHSVERRKMHLDAVRSVGEYSVTVKLAPGIETAFKLNVVASAEA